MMCIEWNEKLCVACGRCIVACVEQNNSCFCEFEALTAGDTLFRWQCQKDKVMAESLPLQNALKNCSLKCTEACPLGALNKKE